MGLKLDAVLIAGAVVTAAVVALKLKNAFPSVSRAASSAADSTQKAAVDITMTDPIVQTVVRDVETDETLSTRDAAEKLRNVMEA